MYDKIAMIMRRDYGATDISAVEVENYLRFGKSDFITSEEARLMETLLERYL